MDKKDMIRVATGATLAAAAIGLVAGLESYVIKKAFEVGTGTGCATVAGIVAGTVVASSVYTTIASEKATAQAMECMNF